MANRLAFVENSKLNAYLNPPPLHEDQCLPSVRRTVDLQHDANLVAGDLRSPNVGISDDGCIYVVDFDWDSSLDMTRIKNEHEDFIYMLDCLMGAPLPTIDAAASATIDAAATATIDGAASATIEAAASATIDGAASATIDGAASATIDGAASATIDVPEDVDAAMEM